MSATTDIRMFFGVLNGNYITITGNASSWNSVAVVNTPATPIGTTPRVLSSNIVSGGTTPYIDGTTMDVRAGSVGTATGLTIFERGTQTWIGSASEITIFPSALSTADRNLLERNQGEYYSVTVS